MSTSLENGPNVGSIAEGGASLSYLWQVPGKHVSVSLCLSVVDGLEAAVRDGMQPIPGRGLEIGGVLLGRIKKNRDGVVVEIDNYQPLECEHAAGPSYLLSANDRDRLAKCIRPGKIG